MGSRDTGTLVVADSEQEVLDKLALERIYQNEKGHGQWKKHGINFFVFLLLVFLDLFRGSKKSKSIFGVIPCSWEDWTSLAVYAIVCVLICWYSVRVIQWE